MPSNQGTHPAAEARPVAGIAPAADVPRGEGAAALRLTREQFGSLFGESWRVLWCAAAGVVRDRTLAQDIVQQAAVVGLEHLDDFDAGTSYVSWMVRIVKNIALNENRKRLRRRTSPTDAAVLDASPAARLDEPAPVVTGRGGVVPGQAEFDDGVARALEGLEETARSCLLMRVVLDLPYSEIARALDIPEGTAASHVHRARRVLRDRLRGEGEWA